MSKFKMVDPMVSPRFCNTGDYMRLPRVKDPADMDAFDFVIFGVPFDTAGCYRIGARFGPSAIRSISTILKPYNAALDVDIWEQLAGCDYGDVDAIPGCLEDTYFNTERDLDAILKNNVVPIGLGGDHSITLGELRSIAKKHGPVALVQFDAHTDTHDLYFGHKYSHGSPFRRAVEEGLIDPYKSTQIGIRGTLYDCHDYEDSTELGFRLITTDEVRQQGFEAAVAEIYARAGNSPVFLTFDIDFVDPAFAPGTGVPEIGGFTSYESIQLLRAMKDLRFVGFDIVEVAPVYDSAEITANLAAHVVHEFLSILAYRKKHGK